MPCTGTCSSCSFSSYTQMIIFYSHTDLTDLTEIQHPIKSVSFRVFLFNIKFKRRIWINQSGQQSFSLSSPCLRQSPRPSAYRAARDRHTEEILSTRISLISRIKQLYLLIILSAPTAQNPWIPWIANRRPKEKPNPCATVLKKQRSKWNPWDPWDPCANITSNIFNPKKIMNI